MSKSALPDLGPEFTLDVVVLVRLCVVMAVEDLWTSEERAYAHSRLIEQYGRIPTLADIAARYGEAEIRRLTDEILQERAAELLRRQANAEAEQSKATKARQEQAHAPIYRIIELVAIVAHAPRFTADEVQKAHESLERLYGANVPTLENLAERMGMPPRDVDRMVGDFLRDRERSRQAGTQAALPGQAPAGGASSRGLVIAIVAFIVATTLVLAWATHR